MSLKATSILCKWLNQDTVFDSSAGGKRKWGKNKPSHWVLGIRLMIWYDSHLLHVWYIYLHLNKFKPNFGKYFSYMEQTWDLLLNFQVKGLLGPRPRWQSKDRRNARQDFTEAGQKVLKQWSKHPVARMGNSPGKKRIPHTVTCHGLVCWWTFTGTMEIYMNILHLDAPKLRMAQWSDAHTVDGRNPAPPGIHKPCK